MVFPFPHSSPINLILAADYRSTDFTPNNDHIWELTTLHGEPPALALSTTFGLRAYGMRLYPRFTQKRMHLSDPDTFASKPIIDFYAPNFVSLNYKPIPSIDVKQKIWVPNSHTVVGQITLENLEDRPINLGLEWFAQLSPFGAGRQMAPVQISINTVLEGQTQNLFPVFFLTGGPQAISSTHPGLTIDLVFLPKSVRQFSWALSNLESTEASFYSARKFTSYDLEIEQVKIQMGLKQQLIDFDFGSQDWDELRQSQVRCQQLVLPSFGQFDQPSFATNRLPDHGYLVSENGQGSDRGWGTISILELWEITQALLPMRPDLVKSFVQNFLDQQTEKGGIGFQVSWSGNQTRLLATPLLTSIVFELSSYLNDQEWLVAVYPLLLESFKSWFDPTVDLDQDGVPEWQHLIQTGLSDLITRDPKNPFQLEIMIQAAEWKTLAILLMNECKSLIGLAKSLNIKEDLDWLEFRLSLFNGLIEQFPKGKSFRNRSSHGCPKGKVLHTFRQNGRSSVNWSNDDPEYIYFHLQTKSGFHRSVVCTIRTMIDNQVKEIKLSVKKTHWNNGFGIEVSDSMLTNISEISIDGLEKGDTAVIGLPNFAGEDLGFIIELWAGNPSSTEVEQILAKGKSTLAGIVHLPSLFKIMWIKGLIRFGFFTDAAEFFKVWFINVKPLDELDDPRSGKDKVLSRATVHELIPILPLMQLLGVQQITENEAIFNGFNEFFPKVNVQYKQIRITLEPTRTIVTKLNGDQVVLEDRGLTKVILS